MNEYRHLVDIALTEDGDWAVEDGDFAITTGMGVIQDDIHMRLMTDTPTLRPYPWFGADLSDFLGQPNSPDIARQVRLRVMSALTEMSNIMPMDVEVLVTPVGRSIVITIIMGDDVARVLELNLDSGLKIVR